MGNLVLEQTPGTNKGEKLDGNRLQCWLQDQYLGVGEQNENSVLDLGGKWSKNLVRNCLEFIARASRKR
jgi:hypothetical protein